jgi:hypothetical protein
MLRADVLLANVYVLALGACAREPVPPVVARDTSPVTDAAASLPEASPPPESAVSGDPVPPSLRLMGFQDLGKHCYVSRSSPSASR